MTWITWTYFLFALALFIASAETLVFRLTLFTRLRDVEAAAWPLAALAAAAAAAALLGLSLGLNPHASHRHVLVAVILALWVPDYRSLRLSRDGSDQILTIVGVSLVVYGLLDKPWQQAAVALYLATMAAMIYFISGLAKLLSKSWRSGVALATALSTAVAGRSTKRPMAAFMGRSRGSARALSLAVVALELSAPLMIASPRPLLVLYLGLLGAFHLGTAVVMRLSGFLYVMPCLFPAILTTNVLVYGGSTS